MNRIAVLDGHTHRDVARFMDCRGVTLVLVHHEAMPFRSHQYSIASVLNVLAAHCFGVIASRRDGSFIQEVGEVRPGETGSSTRHPAKIELWVELHAARVHSQYRFATTDVSQVNGDLTVEAARPGERLVQHIGPVS